MTNPITRALAAASIASVLLAPIAATAAVVQFTPPNDPGGNVYSTGSNDAYNVGRGVVFTATADTVISSVGFLQNLTMVTVSYTVQQVAGLTGDLSSGAVTLVSGSALADTAGELSFIDFTFPAITLLAGSDYLVNFSFEGRSNANFFYNNRNVGFTVGSFASIDGVADNDTSNFVLPAIRVATVDAVAVFEPASLALLASGVLGTGLVRRRRTA